MKKWIFAFLFTAFVFGNFSLAENLTASRSRIRMCEEREIPTMVNYGGSCYSNSNCTGKSVYTRSVLTDPCPERVDRGFVYYDVNGPVCCFELQ